MENTFKSRNMINFGNWYTSKGCSNAQDKAEAALMLASSQRPILIKSFIRIWWVVHKGNQGIWDAEVYSFQLAECHVIARNSLHRAFIHCLQKKADKQIVSSLFFPLRKHNFWYTNNIFLYFYFSVDLELSFFFYFNFFKTL